jgi:hypothetical protein
VEEDVIYVTLIAKAGEFTVTLKALDHQLRSGTPPTPPYNDEGPRTSIFRDFSAAPYKLGFIGFMAPDGAGPLCVNDLLVKPTQETPPTDEKGMRKTAGGT